MNVSRRVSRWVDTTDFAPKRVVLNCSTSKKKKKKVNAQTNRNKKYSHFLTRPNLREDQGKYVWKWSKDPILRLQRSSAARLPSPKQWCAGRTPIAAAEGSHAAKRRPLCCSRGTTPGVLVQPRGSRPGDAKLWRRTVRQSCRPSPRWRRRSRSPRRCCCARRQSRRSPVSPAWAARASTACALNSPTGRLTQVTGFRDPALPGVRFARAE